MSICDRAAIAVLTQVKERHSMHGGKPGPIFEDALADPTCEALTRAIDSVELSGLSQTFAVRNWFTVGWTAGLPQELIIWQDRRWHVGAPLKASKSKLATHAYG